MKKVKKLKKPLPKEEHPGIGGTVPTRIEKTPEEKIQPKVTPEQQLGAQELGSLIAQAEDAETSARGFMEPQATVKKRGRPKGSKNAEKVEASQPAQEEPPPPPPIQTKPAFELAFGITSTWLCRYTNEPRMALLPTEIDALASAWGAVADKHLPAIMSAYALEITAVIVTGTVGMRLYTISASIIAERQREYEARRAAQQSTRRSAETEAPAELVQ